MNMLSLMNQLMLVVTGDDSKPWLIAVCLIVSIVIMIFLFVFGRGGDDTKGNRENKSNRNNKKYP